MKQESTVCVVSGNISYCTESLHNPIAYFSVGRSLEYNLNIYLSKKRILGYPDLVFTPLSLSLHCLLLLFGCLEKGVHKVDLLEQALHELLARVGRTNAPRDERFSHLSLSLLLIPNDA